MWREGRDYDKVDGGKTDIGEKKKKKKRAEKNVRMIKNCRKRRKRIRQGRRR